jgi:hypothetical protein
MAHGTRAATAQLVPGNPVEVRTRFDGTWVPGYRICGERSGRYLIERCSDGVELPVDFDLAELRLTAPNPA